MSNASPDPSPARGEDSPEGVEELREALRRERAERQRIERLLRGERTVLRLLSRGSELDEILKALVLSMEEQIPDAWASLLRVQGGRLRGGPAPNLPEAYLERLDGAPIGPKAGSCGTAAFLGEPVLVEDVLVDPLWDDYRDWVAPWGYRACWSFPVISSEGSILGTFAVYRKIPSLPDAHATELLRRAAQLGALAMERTRTVEALRRSRERLSLIHERAPLGIVLSTVADGRVLEVNEAWLQMVGYTREEVVGKSAPGMGIWVDPEERVEVARELRERGRVAGREIRIRRRSGEIRKVEIHVDLVDVDGAPCAVSLQRDVTEAREQEIQLRRAERLATVGTLVSGVAHELNNPLTAILGFSDDLLETRPRSLPLDEGAWESVDLIRREARRMARIVSDLRLLTRQPHEGEAERVAVDVNEVVRHVLRIRAYSLETHNVAVELDLDPSEPASWGHRADLEQVLLNLLTNAEHAVEDAVGDRRRIGLETRREGDHVAVVVSDAGVGIPAYQVERIFDPFFTTKAPGKGTGLGLSLVQKIVEEKGGDIRVRSSTGEGTEIRLHLPLPPSRPPSRPPWRASTVEATSAKTDPAGGPDPDPPGLRVLIVDDEDAIRSLLTRILRGDGHQVFTASEGGEALRMLDELDDAPVDVILSDLRMPGLSGPDLLKRLRERGRGEDARLLFMTGDAASPEAATTLDTHAVPFLVKPFAAGLVREQVRQVALRARGAQG